MKRLISIFLLALALFFSLTFLARPLIKFYARKQIEGIFPQAKVSILSCSFNPLSGISLRGVNISREKIYQVSLKQLDIDYNLLGLTRASIRKVVLGDLSLAITTPQKNIAEFAKNLSSSGKSPFRIEALEINNAGIDIGAKDLALKAKIFTGLNAVAGTIDYFYLDIDSLDFQGLGLEDLRFKINQKLSPGSLSVKLIRFDSAKISKVSGSLTLSGKSLSLDSLTAEFFGGKIESYGKAELDSNMVYSASFKFSDIDLGQITKDFKLEEKLEMSGRLKGTVLLEGKGPDARILTADFFTLEPGGTLVIKDTSFLEKVARTANQPLDILVESFTDYRYNTGVMRAIQQRDGLVFEAELDGEKGKRRVVVTLHDILPRRE